MKPRLHVSPSSRRQRRPSVHVAQTFAEAAWRPWPSSWASTSAWRHRITPLSSADVVYTLRRFFFVISSSPRLLLFALVLSCFSLIGIVLAFSFVSPSANAFTLSLSLALKYALALLTLSILAIIVRKALAKMHEEGGNRIKTKVW